APGSKGLSPAECRDAALPELVAKIEGHGGAVLTCYKEPLGGNPTIVAILPIDKVKPTPFQRDLSETHAKRLSETIGKIGRFVDGAYQPILRRVDGWLEQPLKEALKVREARAEKIEKLDARVSEVVKSLQAKGFKSPYLKAFVVARVNPLRFMKVMPPFD